MTTPRFVQIRKDYVFNPAHIAAVRIISDTCVWITYIGGNRDHELRYDDAVAFIEWMRKEYALDYATDTDTAADPSHDDVR